MQSLRVSPGFRAFVLDQLSAVRSLRAKDMFGGIGLYADDVFFGIVAADVLYFKVDDTSRQDYENAGSKPFSPYASRTMTATTYYQVPVAVLESAPALVQWARRAVAAANAAKKSPKKTPGKALRKKRTITTHPEE